MEHVEHTAPTTRSDPPPAHGVRRRSAVKSACAVTLSTTALLIAGCGSSSKAPSASGHSATTVTTVAAQTSSETNHAPVRPAAHAASVAEAKQTAANKHSAPSRQPKATAHYAAPRITKGNPVQRPARGTGGNAINDDNPAARASRADSGRPTTTGQPNPCVLVSVAQAQAFTGQNVTAKEAPLGPTCIYQERGSKTRVTTAVERVQFSVLKPHIRNLSKLTIAGRPVYCGVYGTPVTYVLLSGTRVLSISSPCAVGTKFAAAALPKLG